MRVLIRGPVDDCSGYGLDVVNLALTLDRLGVDVHLWPVTLVPGVPGRILELLGKKLAPPYDVALWYAPPFGVYPRGNPGFGRVQVGWTMWERTPFLPGNLPWVDLDEGSADIGRAWSRRSIDGDSPAKTWLDVLIVTCPMNRDAFRAADEAVPIEVIPPGVEVEQFPQVRRQPGEVVRFGVEGVMNGRKDPTRLLEAWRLFRQARPDIKATLTVKSMAAAVTRQQVEATPDTEFLAENWTRRQMAEWLGSLDVYVSASRGEGMNKPAVEAMATGCPVIASAEHGHQNWMSSAVGWPVAAPLEACPFEGGTFDWPVSVEALAGRMALAADNPQDRMVKGNAAANFVRGGLTWERSAERFLTTVSRYL